MAEYRRQPTDTSDCRWWLRAAQVHYSLAEIAAALGYDIDAESHRFRAAECTLMAWRAAGRRLQWSSDGLTCREVQS